MEITSKQNKKVKYLAKLNIKKHRDRENKMLVEGYYPVLFALENGYEIKELFVCTALLRKKFNNDNLIQRIKSKNIPITTITKEVFAKISDYESKEGLLALVEQKRKDLSALKHLENGFYLVLESIEKLSHLGELFRIADSVGVTAVICTDSRGDIFNPQTIRTSLGTVFSVPIVETTSKEAVKWLQENNVKIFSTSPNVDHFYTQVDYSGAIAIAIGAEYTGLSELWLKNSNENLKIPQNGRVESLSVTASAAAVLYEALRQRTN
jgi:TrmH family RNA methyltransferase